MECLFHQLFVSVLLLICALSFSSYSKQQSPLCHEHEKLALLKFKQSFLIDCTAFDHNPLFSYPKTISWESYRGYESGDCCTWDGVECDNNTGYVTELDLSFSCLFGIFPSNSTLFGLTHLEKLNLAYNNFNFSQIPSSIGKLSQLRSLNLSQAVFSGQIPSELSELSKLEHLDFSYNGDRLGSFQLNLRVHNPNLHQLIHNLTHLSQLFFNGVDISSNLPISLFNLTSLTTIFLVACKLYGDLPSEIFQLQNLQVLDLSYNKKLTGHLPEFRSHSNPLRKLDLSASSLSGAIPSSIGQLGCLETIRLYGSHFSGEIPSSLGNLTKLTFLSLSANNFEGEVPSSVRNLTNLNVLGISSLKVKTRNLRSWLSKLNKLTALGLGEVLTFNSHFSVHYLSFLANLTRLSFLNLASNQLTGPIPHWLANMTQLNYLYVPYNDFEGPIPKWFSHLTSLRMLSLSHSNLSGEIEMLWNLKNLKYLDLSGVKLTFASNSITNSSFRSIQFDILNLDACNLMEFPRFLQNQSELRYLSLRGNNIKGTIPQWFMNISKETLLVLDLSENALTSFEQTTSVLPWCRLKLFDLTSNILTGLLPYPSYLTAFYLVSDNRFNATIPPKFCSLTSLAFLDLSDNELSGKILGCIAKLLSNSLIALNMRGNKFSGTIPRRFTSSCTLKMINLSENLLEGKLPRSLANCKMLQVLDVGKNYVHGTFPIWLRSLSELQILVLRNNLFHGNIPIPKSTHGFPNLHVFDLSNNFYTGTSPFEYLQNWKKVGKLETGLWDSSDIMITSYFSMFDRIYFQSQIYNYSITITNKGSERLYSKILNVFRVIDFSNNNFTGQIPDFIGNFTELRELNLSNNHLYGNVPTSLANIKTLESLDLSQNKLSGKIPVELQELTALEVFKVSNNDLSGPIPEGEQFNTFDESSYVGNPGLCGRPLSKKCGDPNIESSTASFKADNDVTEGETPLIDWVVRSAGCIIGLIIGFIIGNYYVTDRYHVWFMRTFGHTR